MRMRILKQAHHLHPFVVQPRTVLVPLLPLVEPLLLLMPLLVLVLLLLRVLSSTVRGVLEPCSV
jgi:hypothetical protein